MSEKSIKVYNPRNILRVGPGQMLEDAANPDNVVLFRAGRMWSPLPANLKLREDPKDDRPIKRPMIRVATAHAVNTYGAEVGGKVFRLVEVPEEELAALQVRYDDQNGFDTIE